MTQEKILTPNPDRFVLLPIQHNDIFQAYKSAMTAFWTAEEIDLSDDIKDWNTKLTPDEKYFISNILGFFAASDGIVNENLAVNFMDEVQYPEARCFYGFQIAMENIHSEVYSLLIDTLIRDKAEKDKLFKAIETIPSVKKKADWALKWINSDSFVKRLIAFAIVEGVMFQGSFCAIYWLKKRGLMAGLTHANELISADENAHAQFAALLYKNHIENKLSREELLTILTEAVEVEKEFITQSLPVRLIGMNDDWMKQYIEYVADNLLISLGEKTHYNTENPFDFMTTISMRGKTNFFEKKVGDYNKGSVISGMNQTTNEFSVTDDF